jgi:competence protein ComEC
LRLGPLGLALAATFEREMERGRGFLWVPVALSVGIVIYYCLPAEPNVWALLALTAAAIGFVWRGRHSVAGFRVALILALVAGGVLAAKLRTDWVSAPQLNRKIIGVVTGWVAAAEETPTGGRRITLRVASIAGVAAGDLPRLARITIRAKAAASLAVGDAISMTASIGPPNGPVMPGGYDFAFVPYYQGIGATGFAYGNAHADPALGPAPLGIRMSEPLARLRDLIRVRIEQALPGDYGHIAAALIMGDQRGIADGTQNAMRASGLGHILSISGLHLALVAGAVFWLVRALLALSPALALNYPIKKWAAGTALAAATFYLGISGAEVATVRSWLMLAVMLSAVLLDRRALTLRNVAFAALLILVISPDSLLSISFQMSFAATIALISAHETWVAHRRASLAAEGARERTLVNRAREVVVALLVTAFVAGLATAPFGAYYFQRIAPLTVVANIAAEPAVGFVVMPMAMLTLVLMPFGLEVVPLTVMKWGLEWMVAVANVTAAWSDGLGSVPALPVLALVLVTAGFLWLALWRERWRLAGLIPIVVALPIAALAPRADIVVAEDAAAVAVRGGDGHFAILGGKGATFDVENWLRADVDPRPAGDPSLGHGVVCDGLGCVARLPDGRVVALAMKRDALEEDCTAAAVVISRYDAPAGCAAAATVVDGQALAASGSHALYATAGGFRVVGAYPAVRRPFMPPAHHP